MVYSLFLIYSILLCSFGKFYSVCELSGTLHIIFNIVCFYNLRCFHYERVR